MAVCDICNAPGMGTMMSSEQMREAVFAKGFDPFKLGLVPDMGALLGLGAGESYKHWKNTIVAQDTSDWNICAQCMAVLQPYLKGAPKPTGVMHATVSSDPTVSARAGAAAEQKYKSTEKPQAPAKKKWWQFWK
ncbi:MAG: hypothetical protein NUW24_00520 [Anaerolineae bacterium]|jgi:hypothetical protein|nr:hypothetical protein [Anaerolineae bacterium]MDH7472529.1 hypothetical protein [Anaerolineae bacterium]